MIPETVSDVRKMNGSEIAGWLTEMADVYDRMVAAETKLGGLKLRMQVALGSTNRSNEWTKLIDGWVYYIRELNNDQIY